MLRGGFHLPMISMPSLRWMRRLRSDTGSTLVESALSITILLTLLIGIMEGCLLIYSYHFISNAAREGTRYAIVRGATWGTPPWSPLDSNGLDVPKPCGSYTDAGCTTNADQIQQYVQSLAFPGIDASQINAKTTWYSLPGGTSGPTYNNYGDYVQVKVTYTFPFNVPFIPRQSLTMSSTSEMVISQ